MAIISCEPENNHSIFSRRGELPIKNIQHSRMNAIIGFAVVVYRYNLTVYDATASSNLLDS
jgi:hypothetical protein